LNIAIALGNDHSFRGVSWKLEISTIFIENSTKNIKKRKNNQTCSFYQEMLVKFEEKNTDFVKQSGYFVSYEKCFLVQRTK